MKILVACEYSGIVRDAFTAKGHDVTSCDLLPTEQAGKHYQGNVFDIINDGWDMMIAHPPCTYLTISGNKWNKPEFKDRFPTRVQDKKDAIKFFRDLASVDINKICIENPVGVMSTEWRKPDQYIQPFQFGEPHAKKTGLWLKNLPKLTPTELVEPSYYIYKNGKSDPTWHMDTKSLPPLERMMARSRTYKKIAQAMADQWG